MSTANPTPPKMASNSLGQPYTCKLPWPAECFVQCGESGVVISPNGNYRTAFFEAFPDTFIRGEGRTVEDAEAAAWEKHQKHLACPEHSFERRGNSEHGTCALCGLFKSHAFKPIHTCGVCGKPHVNLAFFSTHLCVDHFVELGDDPAANADRFPLDTESHPFLLRRQDEMVRSYQELAWGIALLRSRGLIPLDVEDHDVGNRYSNGDVFGIDLDNERTSYVQGLYAKWIALNPDQPVGALSLSTLTDQLLAGKTEFEDVTTAILHAKGLVPSGISEARSAEIGMQSFELFAVAAEEFQQMLMRFNTREKLTLDEVSDD